MLRRWRLPALLALAASAGGCVNDIPSDQPPAATARPAATAPPRPPAHVVVLQRGAVAPDLDRIAIVDRDGRPEAETAFRAPATALQPEPQVTGGAVYFLDASGVVRRLSPAGTPQTVATLPAAPGAAAVAFAVSPDGGRVIASLLSPAAAGRAAHVDLVLSVAGGPPTTLRRIVVSSGATAALRVVGWDTAGPVVLPDAAIAPPAGAGGLWHGHPAHLDAHGNVGAPLGDRTCSVSREQPEGDLLCVAPGGSGGYAATVYGEGQLLHRFSVAGPDPLLAPGEERVASTVDGRRTMIEEIDGRSEPLAVAAGVPVGWLDAGTMVGRTAGRLVSVPVAPPGPVTDLGIGGEVVGVFR